MHGFVLGFLVGVCAIQRSAALWPPSVWLLAAGLAGWGLWWCRSCRWRVLMVAVLGCAVGGGYTTVRAEWRLADRWPLDGPDAPMSMSGRVLGLPESADGRFRFVFAPDASEGEVGLPSRIRMSWFPEREVGAPLPALLPGERLQLEARLRAPTSLFNPGGFDHAQWYLSHGLGARGYVTQLERLDMPAGPGVDLFRAQRRDWMLAEAPAEVAGVLVAIGIGEQGQISAEQWDLLRATGTAHLVAISGLHVSIVALLVGGLVRALWRRLPWAASRLPAQRAAVLGAMVAALGYAALAGFGLPVMRAMLMLVVAGVALWRARRPGTARILSLALLGVLVFDPWAVLSAGFWLSFAAVAALLLVLSGRVRRPRGWRAFVRAQWAITVLTAPLVMGAFGQFSLVGPVANAVAIPWVSVALVPSVLLAVLTGNGTLLAIAGWLAMRLMEGLALFGSSALASVSMPMPPLALVVCAMAGAAFVLVPRGAGLGPAGVVMMLPLVLWVPPRPAEGRFEATVIDVGQGLAVLVRTAAHDVLYDAGPSYYRGGDAGRAVVLPVLQRLGVRRLDRIVLSHDDADHVGGAGSVTEVLPPVTVDGGPGVALARHPVRPCVAGTHWRWDGVAFSYLHPAVASEPTNDNDASCVLRIDAGGQRLLLTGDIRAGVEAQLVQQGAPVAAEVVLAPHHGSRSSSSPAFVAAVGARHVVFSAGYRNRYGHPAPEVTDRWAGAGVRQWNTARDGAVIIDAGPDGLSIAGWRASAQRYWHRSRP